jgi:hypothetical protein
MEAIRTDLIPAVLTSLFMNLRPDLEAHLVERAVKQIFTALISTSDETQLWAQIQDAIAGLEA